MPAIFDRLQRLLLAVFLLIGGASPAVAQALQPVPALSARVVDTSGTLDATQRATIEAQLAEIERQHGAQVVVLLVPGTAPEDIAAYANRVGNAWKIGRRDVGDGVLVIVAKNDRRMRIEVAKTLEGAIPDIAAARIIDGAMKPRFREGDYVGGIEDAVRQIGARIAGETLPAPAIAHQGGGGEKGFNWEDLALFFFAAVLVFSTIARAVLGKRLGGLLMGAGSGIVAFLFTASLLVAGGAAFIALLVTLLGRSGGRRAGSGGGDGGTTWISTGSSGGGSSWSSSSSSSDSFSSGGGGDFGGGGASGDW